MAHAEAAVLHVDVVYSPRPGQLELVSLTLPAGSTLADALRASGLVQRHALDGPLLRAGIWGRVREPSTPLRERDRVEIYRPLRVDPKEARRLRYRQHKERLAAMKPRLRAG